MDVAGIICEYDPFHRGHRRQFELIREQYPGAVILCLMSGCFTQRGMPALYSPAFRAKAALQAGSDLVLELPVAFALRDGEHFALGAVSILQRLGFVRFLSFGAEDDLERLAPAARLLEQPDEDFAAAFRAGLDRGLSAAAAQGAALKACLPQCADAASKPNNILALCYLRAIKRLGSDLQPLPVLRQGDFHSAALPSAPASGQGFAQQAVGAAILGSDYAGAEACGNGAECPSSYPSAKAVRAAVLGGDWDGAEAACGYSLSGERVCLPDSLDRLLLHQLRSSTPEQLAALPYCSEGLEYRLHSAARQAVSREELLGLLKTRRYTYTRLNRLCAHALLGMPQALLDAHPLPEYVRLLGFRRSAQGVLKQLSQSSIPIVSKAADGCLDNPLYQLDMRAYDLWALGAGIPAGLMLRSGVTVV